MPEDFDEEEQDSAKLVATINMAVIFFLPSIRLCTPFQAIELICCLSARCCTNSNTKQRCLAHFIFSRTRCILAGNNKIAKNRI